MTRKDFEMIAKVLGEKVKSVQGGTTPYAEGARHTAYDIVHKFADELVDTNPGFDRDRFLDAVFEAATKEASK